MTIIVSFNLYRFFTDAPNKFWLPSIDNSLIMSDVDRIRLAERDTDKIKVLEEEKAALEKKLEFCRRKYASQKLDFEQELKAFQE